jgi:cell division protein FtsB
VRNYRLLGLSSTRRAAVLALVVCAVVLSVAVPLRNYLAQRGALEDTVQQQERLREQVDGLEQRKAQLSDPAQVEVEARERLRYVRPGETPYIVPPPPSQLTSTVAPPGAPPPDVPPSDIPVPDAPRADGARVGGARATAGGEWYVGLGEPIAGWPRW